MALDGSLRDNIVMPLMCAPMFMISGPALVTAACKAGIMAGLPRMNARTLEEFEAWLAHIRADLDAHQEKFPDARIGKLCVNITLRITRDEEQANLDICKRYGVDTIITASGDPTERIRRVHDWGGQVFHDCTTVRFAEKAIAAGADGIVAIGAGGGGHSGTVSHLALIPKIRQMFDGTLIMAGAVTNGAAVRAAEILGADLAYMGTRFIATQEANAPAAYKQMLLDSDCSDLSYTGSVAGVPANWLLPSLRRAGLDPDNMPKPAGGYMNHDHLPANAKPWRDLWSAGQGIELIDDLPSVAQLVARLRREYADACALPDMADVARLLDAAKDANI